MDLIKIKKITGFIVVKTGLHIGSGNDNLDIGGIDNPVVKDPFTGEPYIPGSTLKGKIRYLLEWERGFFGIKKNENNEIIGYTPCDCGKENCYICKIFGCSDSKKREKNAEKLGPTRVIFRDAFLNRDNSIETYIEEKHENTIDRVKARAVPRSMERVIPGARFNLEIIYKIYNIDKDNGKNDEDNFKKLLHGLNLLELDYLGGGGSRGNGKIKFEDLKDETGQSITLTENS